jgi:Zinc finger, C2H2 type
MSKRRLSCEYEGCMRSYCSSFNLKRHVESSHLGLRKFKCPMCSRLLSSKQNLIDHQNIHSGAKPYKCDFLGCGIEIRQLSQFYLHKQLHAEISSHINPCSFSKTKVQFPLEKLKTFTVSSPYNSPSPVRTLYNINKLDLPPLCSSRILDKLPLIAILKP